MFGNSIDKKKFFTRPDGEKIRDLTQSMFELGAGTYTNYNVYKVPKEYRMRPDLISKAVYNNSSYAEIILKFNSISNPFSIDEGDLILIPDLESALEIVKKIASSEGESQADKIRNAYKYIDPLKRPKKDISLDNFNNREIKAVSLPPNFAEEGAKQVSYRGGRVYFGEGAEQCLKNGMTQSEFLTNVIKNKNKSK